MNDSKSVHLMFMFIIFFRKFTPMGATATKITWLICLQRNNHTNTEVLYVWRKNTPSYRIFSWHARIALTILHIDIKSERVRCSRQDTFTRENIPQAVTCACADLHARNVRRLNMRLSSRYTLLYYDTEFLERCVTTHRRRAPNRLSAGRENLSFFRLFTVFADSGRVAETTEKHRRYILRRFRRDVNTRHRVVITARPSRLLGKRSGKCGFSDG